MDQNLKLSHLQTPIRNNNQNSKQIVIPPSPFLKKLGYGTGIVVYKMERSSKLNEVDSPWAIKKVSSKLKNKNPAFQERINFEAEILRKLDHENIVGFRGLLKSYDNVDCLAMEKCRYCLGDMIEKRFEKTPENPFSADNILKVAYDISKALNYLHNTALILHGDIKSYNILIVGNFELCKLCDFGVAMPVDKNGNFDITKSNGNDEFVGTKIWTAPEILFAYPPIITTKSDIYSYGLVLWEMMALVPPCNDDNSELDESQLSTDSSEDFKRVELPPFDFDESYNFIISLFHCCTDSHHLKRPDATDLISGIQSYLKK